MELASRGQPDSKVQVLDSQLGNHETTILELERVQFGFLDNVQKVQ